MAQEWTQPGMFDPEHGADMDEPEPQPCALFTSTHQDWRTPDDLFSMLDDEFSFTLDAASSHENAKCDKHFTIDDDGLRQSWEGHTVWCNPPYDDVGTWIAKCASEGRHTTVVALVFARTCTTWFHKWVLSTAHEVRFIKGRVKFFRGEKTGPAPAPSMVVVWRPGMRQAATCPVFSMSRRKEPKQEAIKW